MQPTKPYIYWHPVLNQYVCTLSTGLSGIGITPILAYKAWLNANIGRLFA